MSIPLQEISQQAAPRKSGDGDRNYRHLAPVLTEFVGLSPDDPRYRVLRNRLLTGFLPVAHHIAWRYRNRNEPGADLEQAGAIGLIKALDRFAPGPDVDDHLSAFMGYAIPTVTGEIRRHFRDRTWAMRVPRRLKDLQGPMRDTTTSLSRALQRAPRPSEIAAALDVEVDDVIEALHAQRAYTPGSLDAAVPGTTLTISETLGQVDAMLDRVEYRHALRVALAELDDRDRAMIVLRFFGDQTQTQIAEQLGISQMHVSRLLTRSLAALRRRLELD